MKRRKFTSLMLFSFLGTFFLLDRLPAFGKENKPKYRYICGCAMATGCQLSYDQPGTCPCGKPLFKKAIIREDETHYYITRGSEPDCDCSKHSDDQTKCRCGKDLYALEKNPTSGFNCFKEGGCHAQKNGEVEGELQH